jgi:hypothetical protein
VTGGGYAVEAHDEVVARALHRLQRMQYGS